MPSPPDPDIGVLKPDDLRRAADLYLAIAYPSGVVPDGVRRRLDWAGDDAGDAAAVLASPPFERASKPGADPIYALRLGNGRYPHMKLQVQPWACPAGFMLSVNTHDQVLTLDPKAPDSQAFRDLQAENARLKEAIESAWDAAGFPTFLRYLRDYLDAHPAGV